MVGAGPFPAVHAAERAMLVSDATALLWQTATVRKATMSVASGAATPGQAAAATFKAVLNEDAGSLDATSLGLVEGQGASFMIESSSALAAGDEVEISGIFWIVEEARTVRDLDGTVLWIEGRARRKRST